MPDHTSWFTYLMQLPFFRAAEHALQGKLLLVGAQPSDLTLEYTTLSLFVCAIILVFASIARARVSRLDEALVPEGHLTISSFVENFVEAFYGMLRDALGPKDAKFFLPIIGTCAVFIFFSNALGLMPGFAPPTSNLNVTLACGLVIFFTTHYYGLRRNGLAYLKHFIGPVLFLAPLMIVLETISHIARPITLAVRLMVNMFVDHLVVAMFTMLVALFLPVPIMVLGILVVTVQTYVFCLLSTVYIQMAIEHHDEGHDHAHDGGHAHAAHGHAPAHA